MQIWLEYEQITRGERVLINSVTFNPVFVGIFSEVPLTWNIAGRIYFYATIDGSQLLLGTDNVYFNYFHKATFNYPTSGYSILFQPVKYLSSYVIKIGY